MIEIENAGVKFGGNWIFRNLSLKVTATERVVIMGPSGAGKSILLKLLAGLIQPDEGRLKLLSHKVSMLFQKNALFDSISVEENLLLPLKENRGITGFEAKKRAHFFLKEVGLEDFLNHFPDELSGGMQKRLGIARALIIEPEILFYDEPTAGLDPITSRRIADLILKLHTETKSTLLVVTNEVMRAYQLGERIFLLTDGHLVEGGSPNEVKNSKNPMIHQFVEGLQT
jgi:phospholipid/cholesterol/gamma-HCH transport system ATP-binding protein